jgi:hypothetical protein
MNNYDNQYKGLKRLKQLHNSIALLDRDPTKEASSGDNFWEHNKERYPQDLLDAWRSRVEAQLVLDKIMNKYGFKGGR